ncbi:hypothetical protein GCM10010218_55240 [Streptomyces mashuensis]|uniref:TerD domain-containing protein n=1 Tax=Streptomyces mashuensis TaxID=33904 RepID=A0A919EER3_9ACTN|nr:TerD family protein [Streptomyces mashuensis]GHF66603.1 hypothetical protein GCM10010218_55240 [Streptomyces mashuensis]
MTAELVRGQNHPLTGDRLEVRVAAERPVVAVATLGDADGAVRSRDRVAHPGSPVLPGLDVPRQPAAEHRLAVGLAALAEDVHRVYVALALPPAPAGPDRFGAFPAPVVEVAGPGGTPVVRYVLEGLDRESAVVAVELYRRQGAWKVRAVGQGYAEGLTALLHDQGLPEAAECAAEALRAAAGADGAAAGPPVPGEPAGSPAGAGSGGISYRHPGRQSTAAVATPPAEAGPADAPAPASAGPEAYRPVAGDATGWSMDERLYNQVWGMFEDLARSVAAYRSAVDFAEARLDQRLDEVLSDPRTRVGPAADAAREEARAQQAALLDQARSVLDRDLAQLAAEAEVVEHALPPAYARWDNPVWHAYQVPLERPLAVRLGDLRLPESDGLRIPMLVRLPLERGLWVDSGRPPGGVDPGLTDAGQRRRLAVECAVAVAARLLAVHPVGTYTVHVVDPAGAAGTALAPLREHGALKEAPAGARGVTETLERLTRRVDLAQMAVRSGVPDALPEDFDPAGQLLIVHDFPHGFDDRAVTQLRYLADEGPAVGVHLLMVADRAEARGYGPVLDPLWKSLLRITPVPDDHLADPWVGHAWTYEPPLVPAGSGVLDRVLWQVGQARRACGA